MSIVFEDITKVFADGTVALDQLNLEFESGEFIVFLGPSGSGKTTACRIMAGLEHPTSGRLKVQGREITNLPPRERGMSMVFQNYALYPHKTVRENIAYPLRVRKWGHSKREQAVADIAKLLQIHPYLDRRPKQLSGGQAQRVAVARALVSQPEICLMDEPLSNLDALLRLQTRTELKRLHARLERTFVFVTHDQEEAMTLGTRIAVLNHGKLVQFDTPKKIYHQPKNRFVAEFIGRPAMNTIEGKVTQGVFQSGSLEMPFADRPDGEIVLGIRPEKIVIHRTTQSNTVPFHLEVIERIEPETLLYVVTQDCSLMVRVADDCEDLHPGQPIYLEFPEPACHFFDHATGDRIE